MSLAVVLDDQVVFVDGFGIRSIDDPREVNEHTIFAGASLTKAMVATVLQMLIEDGQLQDTALVVDHLPQFSFFDQWVEEKMMVSDLLCHWSGLPDYAGDLLFLNQSHQEIIKTIGFVEPVQEFRTSFAYQNILYLIAAEVITSVTGRSWESLVQEWIFAPLGMQRSVTNIFAVEQLSNISYGHLWLEDGWHVVNWNDQVDFGAAAGVASSCWDMAQWIRAVLSPGKEGRPDWDVALLMQPQVFLPVNAWVQRLYRKTSLMGCGRGWFSYDYFGHRVVEHSGNLPGLSAKMALVPDKGLGVVVFCNQHESLLPHAIIMTVLDEILALSSVDWIHRMKLIAPKIDKRVQKVLRDPVQGPNSKELIGTYQHPLIGNISIHIENDIPVLLYGRMAKGRLSYKESDGWDLFWEQVIPRKVPGDLVVEFQRSSEGEIDSLHLSSLGKFNKISS